MKIKNKKAFSLVELSIVLIVIGLLVAGITKGSSLIRESKIKAAKMVTQNSPVLKMKGLALWLDSTNSSSISTSGSTGNSPVYDKVREGELVNAWKDVDERETNKIAVTQGSATSTDYPTYVKNGINGLPSINFERSNKSHLITTNSTPLTAGETSFTYIAVWKPEILAGYLTIFGQGENGASFFNSAAMMSTNGGDGIHIYNGAEAVKFSTTITSDSTYISIMTVNNPSDVVMFHNSLTSSTPLNYSANPLFSVGELFDEAFAVGTMSNIQNAFDGLISEIIIFSRPLKNSESVKIMEYLSKKYSVPLS